ncbi:MAG: protein-glutamate O-methyltransferase CheR [Ruminobacter sp.]|nr:protein-glutamate O-methyltransferase CheR [Ruminobacter sp.]
MAGEGLLNATCSKENYELFCKFLEQQCGIVLGENKQYLVRSRLSSMVAQYKCTNLDDLLRKTVTSNDRGLQAAVVDAMTTNETLWFRDNYPFDYLSKTILPTLGKTGRPIRIWSAASSSGQEPYSIAMSVLEQTAKIGGVPASKVSILATDISTTMLDICKTGIYDSLALSRGLSAERKKVFFEKVPDNPQVLRVSENVRKMVQFRQQNLLGSFSLLGKFDIVFCRNVLIYFSTDVKQQIISNFAKLLNPGGYLFLGSSEYLPPSITEFEMLRCNPGIVFRKKDK